MLGDEVVNLRVSEVGRAEGGEGDLHGGGAHRTDRGVENELHANHRLESHQRHRRPQVRSSRRQRNRVICSDSDRRVCLSAVESADHRDRSCMGKHLPVATEGIRAELTALKMR